MLLDQRSFNVERSGPLQGDRDPEEGELRAWSPERRQQEAARRSAAEVFLRAKEEHAEQPAPRTHLHRRRLVSEKDAEQPAPQLRLHRHRPQASPRTLAISRPLLHTRHGIFARAVGAAVAQPKVSHRKQVRAGDGTLSVRHSSHIESKRQDVSAKRHGVRLVRKTRKRKRVREHVHVGENAREQAALATLRLLDTSAKEKSYLRGDFELRKAAVVFNDSSGKSLPSARTSLDERLGNSPQLPNSMDILDISSDSEAEGLPANFVALPVEPLEAASDMQEETPGSDLLEFGSACMQDDWLICKANCEELVQAGLRLAHAFAEL